MEKNKNYGYIYWENTLTDTWYAIPRDMYILFFNGKRKLAKGVLSDKSITNLIKLVNKTDIKSLENKGDIF